MSTMEGERGDDRESVVPSCHPPETAARKALMIPEILVLIINHTDTKADDLAHAGSLTRTMTAQDTPLPFMFVCKAWYEILSSAPSLWNTVIIFIQCVENYSDIDHLPFMFEYCLRRSKDMPLTLHISASFMFVMENDEARHALFVELVVRAFEHQHRWENVHISLECYGLHSQPFVDHTRNPIDLTLDFNHATMLKNLSIVMPADVKSHFPKDDLLALAHANKLQSLRLGNVKPILLNTDFVTIPAYFPNLRTLDLSLMGRGARHQNWVLLGASPNIQSLKADHLELYDSLAFPSAMPPLSFNNLRSLAMDSNTLKHLLALMDRTDVLSLKKLNLLRFDLHDDVLSEVANQLKLLQNPFSELELDIYHTTEFIDETAVAAFLDSFVKLERLQLDVSRFITPASCLLVFANALLEPQLGEEHGARILPQLKTLELTVSPGRNLSQDDPILGAVKSIIMACKRRSPNEFRISVRQHDFGVVASRRAHMHELDMIQEVPISSLLDDMDIRQCVTETFTISIESENVSAICG